MFRLTSCQNIYFACTPSDEAIVGCEPTLGTQETGTLNIRGRRGDCLNGGKRKVPEQQAGKQQSQCPSGPGVMDHGGFQERCFQEKDVWTD